MLALAPISRVSDTCTCMREVSFCDGVGFHFFSQYESLSSLATPPFCQNPPWCRRPGDGVALLTMPHPSTEPRPSAIILELILSLTFCNLFVIYSSVCISCHYTRVYLFLLASCNISAMSCLLNRLLHSVWGSASFRVILARSH